MLFGEARWGWHLGFHRFLCLGPCRSATRCQAGHVLPCPEKYPKSSLISDQNVLTPAHHLTAWYKESHATDAGKSGCGVRHPGVNAYKASRTQSIPSAMTPSQPED